MLYRFLYLPFSPLLAAGAILLLWDIAAALRAKASPRAAVRFLWEEDHWLGTEKYAACRKEAGQLCYVLAMVLYLAWNVAANSCWDILQVCADALYNMSLFFALTKILLCSRYAYKRAVLAGICLLPLLAAAGYSQNMVFLATLLVLAMSKDIKRRPAVQAGLAVVAFGFFSIAGMALSGRIPMDALTDTYAREHLHKYALGMVHPNVSGYLLMFLVVGWFLLRFGKMRWFDWGVLAALAAVIALVVKSRASALAVCVMVAAGETARLAPRLRENRIFRGLWIFAGPILAGLSFWGAVSYTPSAAIWKKLDGLFSGRLSLFQQAVQSFHITLFGQNIRTEAVYTLDNAYLYIFYRMGILCFALLLIGTTLLMKRLFEDGCFGEAAAALGLLCYGLMESAAFWPAVNITVWFLPALLWKERLQPLCTASAWEKATKKGLNHLTEKG